MIRCIITSLVASATRTLLTWSVFTGAYAIVVRGWMTASFARGRTWSCPHVLGLLSVLLWCLASWESVVAAASSRAALTPKLHFLRLLFLLYWYGLPEAILGSYPAVTQCTATCCDIKIWMKNKYAIIRYVYLKVMQCIAPHYLSDKRSKTLETRFNTHWPTSLAAKLVTTGRVSPN